ncbi:MAG: cytochrome c [Gaiellales bacterium]
MLLAAITTLGKSVLLAVAITFIVWSLVTALVIPKRYPSFPRRLDLFLVLSAVLFLAQMSAVVWVTGTQEVEEQEAVATETTDGASGGETAAEDVEAGKDVFASAGCASCHTLADAGATGAVGPNLDELKPTAEMVSAIVPGGRGAMPGFGDKLSETDIANVAAYVSTVAGK